MCFPLCVEQLFTVWPPTVSAATTKKAADPVPLAAKTPTGFHLTEPSLKNLFKHFEASGCQRASPKS